MRYESTITSKGTITIAAPIRKALGLKPGQTVRLELDKKNNRVLIDTGMTIEQLEKIRDEVLSKYPDRPRGLSMKAMRDRAAVAWLAEKK
ncbi:MAG TPA: AbrB/MazE/SpoVT family DNA-binding domain-containing protein [Pyrinomonadaceae bacterium]|nr:AbrB/MazE/SpoVT family DNA-binding domain-containing protein [Pyrinomonadaceae bacterium]